MNLDCDHDNIYTNLFTLFLTVSNIVFSEVHCLEPPHLSTFLQSNLLHIRILNAFYLLQDQSPCSKKLNTPYQTLSDIKVLNIRNILKYFRRY